MRRLFVGALLCGGLASAIGCGYSGVAMPSPDKVVVTRNDWILFGLLRKVYVCKVTDTGLTACSDAEAP